VRVLTEIGLKVRSPQASLYVWAKIPPRFSSTEFAAKLLDEVGVVVTPGIGYGRYGEGYIRLSLTIPDDRLEEGVARLRAWHASQGNREL
jgi:LL-diaminopimelate aminotransferase